jgi:hypothetical protein
MSDLLPVHPTALREFTRTDSVTAFVRLYQGGHDAMQTVSVAAHIVDVTNRAVFERTEPVSIDRFDANRVADYRLVLPTATLMPGTYLLTLEITRARERETRNVRFTMK